MEPGSCLEEEQKESPYSHWLLLLPAPSPGLLVREQAQSSRGRQEGKNGGEQLLA